MNYIKIREYIDSHGYVPNQTVVMTDEKLFMAYMDKAPGARIAHSTADGMALRLHATQ